MSGFLIAADISGCDPLAIREHHSRAIAAYLKKGMRLTATSVGHGVATLLFANPSHDPAEALSSDTDGRTCTYVGTLLYRSKTGKAATDAILADSRAGHRNWLESVSGNFCLLLGDRAGLRLITDGAGLHHVFHNSDYSLIANSFLAASCALSRRTVSRQEVLEYILLGATFGRQSPIREVQLLPAGGEIQISETQRAILRNAPNWHSPDFAFRSLTLDERIEQCLGDLDDYYGQIAGSFDSRVTASLSGGHDSRLSLALMRRHGIAPKLFVYGRAGDADVRIAKQICAGEGLPLEHIDRTAIQMTDPETYWHNQEDVFQGLDGRTQYGFACDPVEFSHRQQRVSGGLLAVNGGGGEIWRDYWKLPAKEMTALEFVTAYYGGRAAGLNRDQCSEQSFLSGLAAKVDEVVGSANERMSPEVVQSLYARFRVRHWQGANNSIDNHVGFALTPFSETRFSYPAAWIPVSAKRNGWFERQLIMRSSPPLARYQGSDGFDFASGPGFGYRLKTAAKVHSPVWLRLARRRSMRGDKRPYYQSERFIRARFGSGPLNVEEFVVIDSLHDSLCVSRALTVERLLRDELL